MNILVPLLIIVIVLITFSYLYIGSKKLISQEKGKVPIYQEQCGGRFDALNLTIPFVRFTMYDDFIVAAYGKKRHIIKFDEIEKIEIKNYILSKGIKIIRKNKKTPYQIIIWSRKPHSIVRIFKQKNIPVVWPS